MPWSDSSSRRRGDSSLTSSPSTPLRNYFSRKSSSKIRTIDLPFEHDAIGVYSPWGIFWGCIFLTVPMAYIYILLILLREICMRFPDTIYQPIQHYIPILAKLVSTMEKSSTVVEVWCIIEAVFYVCLKSQIKWLQHFDPLERSLSSAPMMELEDRKILWDRMMDAEQDDPVTFVSGWFFDQPLENISKYDIRDFAAWSMFEGRNQEHLTGEELTQLDGFVEEMEWRISLHLYGEEENSSHTTLSFDEKKDYITDEIQHETGPFPQKQFMLLAATNETKPGEQIRRPKKMFRFDEGSSDEQPNFFSNLYENYKQRYELYRNMIDNTDFHPVQDFRNFMAETRQQIAEAEESAVATATHMCENAYNSLIAPGSSMDKQLSAIGHATQVQLTEAWNSVKGMRERLETAQFLSSQRKTIRQQLKGYRLLLNRMRSISATVPSKQMATLMRKITECNEAMERLESSAREAFVNATGYARKNILQRKEPQRYAKYSSDPLLGIATYPLMFHLLILGATETPLRIMLRNRGFTRLTEGPVAYYYHPGTVPSNGDADDEDDDDDKIPIVFVHGIGIGLIVYIPLIDCLLKSGRPIILPEIPYVSGFRPWQGPNAVLPPAVVTSTLTAILATHGYLRGAFVGHSYGTSWLSYMCKYAPNSIAAALFLDPICFCLHVPRLTKQFVYHRPDPGTISYMVRTDLTVNWTIQRSFPWSWIIIFTEDINVPCSVFLSDRDALVPAVKVENYLKSKGAQVKDFADVDRTHFASSDINVTVFRGAGHGDWTDHPTTTVPTIADCVEVLCTRATKAPSEATR